MSKRIVVSGGWGGAGSHIVRDLLENHLERADGSFTNW